MSGFRNGLPWWVKWVAVPLIALVVFGGLIAAVIGVVVALLFKVVLFAVLVCGLVFVVKRFTASSSSSRSSRSSRDDW